ncbi:TRAF-type zinc finger protein (macronuclear) [Tetrahymena thermophila SB210]|uniref:TRAF-type zinc finger protein n=1 Tax=Tetrahymena thermophila (strain SB210) TaxID=312017 RepID=I7M982_TETTS|nr:TRAF-type zinc finger protein [Tetrahymena thermophila SB210]EAS01087.1 TRAF-type zinc finger protein [Tetrahymena thermophila SB210]|eukprot:XP_001021332.1 TRAF-type zinc finger protein [Tetrahymena thermophila SB210]
MSQEIEEKTSYYYFNSDRICSVVDQKEETTTEEDKFQDYQCYICYEISLDIKECKSCETIFCNRCIDLIKKKKKDQPCSCPNNCKEWILNKPHRSIRNFIENIEFYCKNYQLGCRQKLKLLNANQHESVDCDYNFVSCENKGCQQQVQLKSIKQHLESECSFRIVKCEKCDLDYVFSEQQNHDCIQSLKKEVASLKHQISSMYTKEQLDKQFQDFLKSENQNGLQIQQKEDVNLEYNYPKEEEVIQQQLKQDNQQVEQNKQEDGEEQKENNENKEQNENMGDFLKRIFESGIQMIKGKYENQMKEQQVISQLQNYQQSQANIPVYPRQQSLVYPPQQSQVQSNFYPPSQYYQSTCQNTGIYPPNNNYYNRPQSMYNYQQYPSEIQSSNYNGQQYYSQEYYSQSSIQQVQQNKQDQNDQNKTICNHKDLEWISSGTPVNKFCSCGSLVTHNYYYCKICDKYTCLNCKN